MSAWLPSRRIVLFAPLLMVPPGCSVLPTPSVAKIYRLSPQMEDPHGHPIPSSKLTVDLPTASQSLDTNRIALTQGRTRFDYYADSVWTDRLPLLLQSLMVEAFEADGRIGEVGRDAYGVTRGYLLRTDIRQFEARYTGTTMSPPEIVVVLELQLSADSQGRSVGKILISARAHPSENEVDAIVIAFDTATGNALTQTVAWTLQAISMDRAHGARPARVSTPLTP